MKAAERARRKAHERIAALLERMPLIDGHNDLPMVIRHDPVARGNVALFGLDRRRATGDTDIPRLREGGVSGQVWAAFVPSDTDHPAVRTLEQIAVILQMQDVHPDVFHPALTPDDFLHAKKLGRIASMIAVEGAVGLENSVAPLRVWHASGVRLVTLCHNGTLDWVDSATDEPRSGGISEFGRSIVRELNRLGMMVDCAHVSADAMRQVLEVSSAPVVFSHSNARAICNHTRNIPDDVLASIPANDGLVMATFVPHFVSEEFRKWFAPFREVAGLSLDGDWARMLRDYETANGAAPVADVEQVAAHVEYIAARVGHQRVGIGSDFWGGPTNPEGLADVACFPNLLAEMAVRGWTDDHIAGLAGMNFVRVFRQVEQEGERLRKAAGGSMNLPGAS